MFFSFPILFMLTLLAQSWYHTPRSFAASAQAGRTMPLCIAGMHRSGTSLIASLLHDSGLDLGPETDLLPPAEDNPEGFWESRSFLKLNDAILKELGGVWDRPPRMRPAGWEIEPRFHWLREQALRQARRFRGREPWGWKDPRNCLTLPLWRSILPETRVLICVRNPLAVAESLGVRNGMSASASFDLWLTYNQRVLATSPECRVVTHYESYYLDPRAELRRVLRLLGMTTTEACLDRACARINPSLVHHRVTVDELIEKGSSAELVTCYLQLCDEGDLPRGSVVAPSARKRARPLQY